MVWISIIAIITGPVLAVHIQRRLDEIKAQRERRLTVFRHLMATRARDSRITPLHVQSLNMIDIEFQPTRYEKNKHLLKCVLDAWKLYLDHLNTPDDGGKDWDARANDLFIDLLHTISICLGYSFDKVVLRKGIYFPQAFDTQALFSRHAQLRFLEILEGKRPVPIAVVKSDANQTFDELEP